MADQPGFADELLAHFNQLPTRSGFSLPSCFCRRPFWVPFANSHVSRSWVPARNSRLQREREGMCDDLGWVEIHREKERDTHTECVRACVNILDGWKFTERERERERWV